MTPWLWLAIAVWSAVAFGTGYYRGHQDGRNGCLAGQATNLQATIKQAQAQAAEQARAELKTTQEFEAARETVRTVYIRIKEKADENIDKNGGYDGCGLDADGLRLYNARPASHVTSPPASGITDHPLSGSAGSPGRTAGNPFTQQPGKIGAVLRVPEKAQSPGGVGNPATANKNR